MSIFMHQGSQKTPGSSSTTNEHTHVPSLLRSPLWQPDFCLMHTSDMLLVLYKATDALKSHTSVLAPALTPKERATREEPLLCYCLWRDCPLHTTSRGYHAIKQEWKTINMHKAQAFPWKPSSGYPVENCSWVRHPSTDLLGSWQLKGNSLGLWKMEAVTFGVFLKQMFLASKHLSVQLSNWLFSLDSLHSATVAALCTENI